MKLTERRRKLEERQRAYEREIRRCKRLSVELKGIDPEKASAARRRAVELNKKYVNFSRESGIAYYPERTKILDKAKGL